MGNFQRLRGEITPALCATNRVPISYELSAANAAEVRLTKELLAEAELETKGVARKLLGVVKNQLPGLIATGRRFLSSWSV
jgi:hypothetical protein